MNAAGRTGNRGRTAPTAAVNPAAAVSFRGFNPSRRFDMSQVWAEEDDYTFEHFDDFGKEENQSGFGAAERPLSDKFRRQSPKPDRRKGAKDDPLKPFGPVVRSFVLENIKVIDYRDIAAIAGVSADDLKMALEKCGIKVSEDTVPRWEVIDLGRNVPQGDCARCQVQRRHSSFIVGADTCRACYEQNIRHWIRTGEHIRVIFTEMS
jgi:hypothetical protein